MLLGEHCAKKIKLVLLDSSDVLEMFRTANLWKRTLDGCNYFFPVLTRVVFSVFKWSVTLVLVFHFVSKPLSVPSGYYLSLQLVNKQPG